MSELSDPQAHDLTPSSAMTFGQILDRTYRLMRAHLRLFFSIAAVPATAIFAFTGVLVGFLLTTFGPQLTGKTPNIGAIAGGVPVYFAATFLVCYPVILLVYALYLPAAFFAATQANRGVIVTFRKSYELAWSRLVRSLWLMILGFLYVLIPVAVIAALIIAAALLMNHGTGAGAGAAYAFFLVPLLVLLYLGILIYSVLIMLRFAVAYPASVEENLTAWASLQRSANLTRGAKGRIFLVLLVIYAILYALELAGILVLLVLAAIVGFIAMSAHVTVGSPAFYVLAGLGVLGYLLIVVVYSMLAYAAFTAALAVIYHDQRLRKDVPMA
jgi:hypothetical protein